MCRSVLAHDPTLDVAIVVVDRKRALTLDDPQIQIIWAEEIGFPDYLQSAFKYNIIEMNTAVKPHAAAQLLERYAKVIYLDPDTFVFNSLTPVLDALDVHDLLLSPHALRPFDDEHRPNDVDLLRFGSFNLGFFALRAGPNAQALLRWWDARCQTDCFYEPALGFGVDQKWMDLAPCFFDGVHVFKHPGVNVAFWNLHERALARDESGRWIVNDAHPLIFFHFSSYDEADNTAVAGKQTRYGAGSRPDFEGVRNEYSAGLAASARTITTASLDYGYAVMSDGSAISPALRRFYAARLTYDFADVTDPFDATSPVHAFARRNRLFSTQGASQKHVDFKAENQFGRQKAILDMVFRTALRVLGPDRYFMLMRYFGSFSSILKQETLLK